MLDVVENWLGEKPSKRHLGLLTRADLEDVRDRLNEFWAAQATQSASDRAAYLVGDWLHAYWSEPTMRQSLSDALLYFSSIVVLDPLADFFGDRASLPDTRGIRYRRADGRYNTVTAGPQIWSNQGTFDAISDASEAVATFGRLVTNLFELEPLIRADVVRPCSQWHVFKSRMHQITTSVRHDVATPNLQTLIRAFWSSPNPLPVWDNLRGVHVEMDGSVHPSDDAWRTQHEFFYLAKTLAIADAVGAEYVPAYDSDMALLKAKIGTTAPQFPGELLREISRIVLPAADIPITRAIEVRESSENFEDWRSSVDDLRRATNSTSIADLESHVADILIPRARAVRREVARGSLAGSFRESGVDWVTNAAVGLGTAAATGGGALSVGAGAGAGALAWLVRAYFRPGPQGADAILSTLIRPA